MIRTPRERLAASSPMPLVSHWPGETEKHQIRGVYRETLSQAVGEADYYRGIPVAAIANALRRHILIRTDHASREARRLHGKKRHAALDGSIVAKSLQDASHNQSPARRVEQITATSAFATELYARMRLDVDVATFPDESLAVAVMALCKTKMRETHTSHALEKVPQTVRLTDAIADTDKGLYYTGVQTRYPVGYLTPEVGNEAIVVQRRDVGVLALDPDVLTPSQLIYLQDLAFYNLHTRRPDSLPPLDLSDMKDSLREVIEQDSERAADDKLIVPVASMIYLCKEPLQAVLAEN